VHAQPIVGLTFRLPDEHFCSLDHLPSEHARRRSLLRAKRPAARWVTRAIAASLLNEWQVVYQLRAAHAPRRWIRQKNHSVGVQHEDSARQLLEDGREPTALLYGCLALAFGLRVQPRSFEGRRDEGSQQRHYLRLSRAIRLRRLSRRQHADGACCNHQWHHQGGVLAGLDNRPTLRITS